MSTTEAPPVEVVAEKKKSEPRPYVVLRNISRTATTPSGEAQPQTWEFVRNVTAISAEQAIREAAGVLFAASDVEKLELVAVPTRNFRPVTVEAEVETKLKFS